MGALPVPLDNRTAEPHSASPSRAPERTWDDFSIDIGAIDPESEHIVDFTWINTDHPGQPSVGTTVIFRDASGQWWRRHLAEPIERVHDDPENSGPTPSEHVNIRAQQVAMGFEPMAEHALTFRVRWYRFGAIDEASPHSVEAIHPLGDHIY